MRQWRRAPAALGVAAALAAGAACDDGSGRGGAEIDTAAAVELARLVNETRMLEYELDDAEHRLIRRCLEEAGFEVHNEWELGVAAGPATVSEFYPFADWLPDVETAERRGFGVWTSAPEAQDDPEIAALGGAADNTAFESLPPEVRRDWYVAYVGEDWTETRFAADYLTDAELSRLAESPDAAGLDAADAGPGGCLRETIESVYGEDEPTRNEGGEWTWRPRAPVNEYDFDERTLHGAWRESLADAEAALLDCLEERGNGGWRFDGDGELPVWAYWQRIYAGTPHAADVPAPPDDLPEDFAALREAEVAMAVDVAECGTDSGYREAARTRWDELHYETYSAVEADLRAWHEAVADAVRTARELVGG